MGGWLCAEANEEFLETLLTLQNDIRPHDRTTTRGAPDLSRFSFDDAYKYYVALSRLQNSLWGTLNKLGHEMKSLTPEGMKTRYPLHVVRICACVRLSVLGRACQRMGATRRMTD